MTPFERKLTEIITPSLDGMGYDLVRAQMRGETRKTLQVMVERKDMRAITLDDCETVSETVSALLDVHDPIKERYALEVSSAGIDRPLMKWEDFMRYLGFEAKITLKDIFDGRRNVAGILRNASEQEIQVELENGEDCTVPFDMVARAKLVLTDALIEAHLKAQQEFNPINQEPVSLDADTQEA